MPIPFLVPAIGALVGTAAAPALGMSAALAAGLGGGIATLAAGGSPQEALMSGITGGIGGALVPGIAGAAGKGAAAAAGQGAASAGGAAAVQAAPQMAANEIAKSAIASSGGNISNQLTQSAIKEAAKSKINPMQVMQAMQAVGGGGQQPQPQQAAAAMSLPMNPGGESGGGSAQAMERFSQLQPGDLPNLAPQAADPSIRPVGMEREQEMDRIPLRLNFANGGLASLAGDEMARRGMDSLPNLGDRQQAYEMARRMFAEGGFVEGPGTGTSDDIPATIYQNGKPVQDAALSDGEFVMTAKAVKGAGGGDRSKGAAKMYEMMRQFEGAA